MESRVSAGSSGAREERKVVSVLFADLVDFVARSESGDPEDLRAVLAPYFDGDRRILEKVLVPLGLGTVNR